MSTVVKDLGPVTAYADAVAAGYTGTKEEWQALMASYASVAEEAQEAKEGAEAAQEAAESARDAAIDAKEGAEDAVDGFGAVVTQATNQAVQTVRAEGTTQVGNVSSEGTTQVTAVQAKGTEVIQSIPADYTQLSSDVTQLKEDLNGGTKTYTKTYMSANQYSSNKLYNAEDSNIGKNLSSIATGATMNTYAFMVDVTLSKKVVFPVGTPVATTVYGNLAFDENDNCVWVFRNTDTTRVAGDLITVELPPNAVKLLLVFVSSLNALGTEYEVTVERDGIIKKQISDDYRIETLSDDLTDISNKVESAIIEGTTMFDPADFVNGGLSDGQKTNMRYRVCSYPSILVYSFDLYLSVNSGYRFGIHTFNDNDEFVSDSGWITSSYKLPKNTKFRIVIAKVSEDTNILDVQTAVSQVSFDTKTESEIKGLSGIFSYYYDGEPIDFKRKGFNTQQLFDVPTKPEGTGSHQGFAIFGTVLFQLYSDNKITLVNYPEGTTITTMDIVSDHGDTMDFSDEYYDSNDEFPLAYITSDTTPMKVYVVRITRSSTTLVRTYYFGDVTKTGYYAGHCLDAENNILYTVGYTENSYYLDESGTNKMIVAKWDLDDCTTNQDNTLTPSLVDSFTTKFMRTVQGQRYFDNKLFILSSHNTAGGLPCDTTIYVIDPFKQIIISTMASFPLAIKNYECEAIEFILNDNKYDMITSSSYRNKYYKLMFA